MSFPVRRVPSLLKQTGQATSITPFSAAHKSYVQSLYRRYLKNELNWVIRRDVWRKHAMAIRVAFEENRGISNPRELAYILQEAEKNLQNALHPDPYIPPLGEEGTKWERNIPPPVREMDWVANDHHDVEAAKADPMEDPSEYDEDDLPEQPEESEEEALKEKPKRVRS